MAVGGRVRDDLLAAGIGRPSQYVVLPPGTAMGELPDRLVARLGLGVPFGVPLVSFIGRVTKVKRPDRFLEVARRIKEAVPAAHFLICGEGDLLAEVREAGRDLGGALHLVGWRGDVESVYKLARAAAEKAHRDRRPAFLNIKCCRYLEHVGTGDDWHWGYRDKATVEREWISRDALVQQRARLLSLQVSESVIAAMEGEIDRAIQASVAKAGQAPIPAPERLYAGVFHEKA